MITVGAPGIKSQPRSGNRILVAWHRRYTAYAATYRDCMRIMVTTSDNAATSAGGWQGGPNLGDFEAPSGRRGLGQYSDMIGGLVEWSSGMGLQSLHRAPWKYEPAPIKSHVTSLSLGDHVWGKRYSKPKYRGAIGSMPPAIRGMVRLLTF
ncbi:hypothetical protein BDV37DRAFT_241870 [Aspergillus pseudonomiae]|uniref:Uncharacterized protein n=1 Tax=Aspergillus pseudonomiae TaxID=1506151 RepID=A0A5N7DKU9_9EURO|nr:uncharacterized protein BDV37DRAFT_241870 [Aspergillus pseudonomiae]KAE8407077.1 hypothetical protein BDV37DRAFT_241870 [Aspergillus pseudonomiae]